MKVQYESREDLRFQYGVVLPEELPTNPTAHYDTFYIGDAASFYQLHISGHSGRLGDALENDNGSAFSTKDADNDNTDTRHCAVFRRGGWWHSSRDCTNARVNGDWDVSGQPYAISWAWNVEGGSVYITKMSSTELMVRVRE